MKARISIFLSFFLLAILPSFAQNAGDFRTAASGDWNTAATWQTFDGSSWIAATAYPSATDGYIIVAGGHVLTIPSTITITADQIMVQENAQILIAADAMLEVVNGTGTDLDIAQAVSGTVPGMVKVSGILKANNDATIVSATNSLIAENGGTYQHHYSMSSGNIPLGTWNIGSILLISGYTTNELAPGNLGQAFHHVVWNTPDLNNTKGFINFEGALKTVNGNLTVSSTGVNFLSFSGSATDVLTVNNNFIIQTNSIVKVNFHVQVKKILALSNSTLENIQGLSLADGANFLLEGSSVFSGISTTAEGAYSVHYKDISSPKTTGLELPTSETSLTNLAIENSTISLSNSITVNGNLTIETSGTLRLNGNDLYIEGNFINNGGAFEGGTNKISFNGINTQSVEGTAITTFYDLEILNTAAPGLIVKQSANISNSLILGEGVTFDPDGGDLATDGGINVTFLSTAYNQAAAIVPIPATSKIVGNVVLQHYIPPVQMYRYLTTTTKGLTLDQWTDDFEVRGTYQGGPGGSASIYIYDEPQTKYIEFPGPSGSLSSPIEIGKGYAAYMYNGTTPTIIDTRGQVLSGDFTFNLSYTESSSNKGVNFIGNPYPSAIEWASPHWQRNNVSPTVVLYDRVSGKNVYSTLNALTGIGLNSETTKIGSGQGFFINALATGPRLTATEMVKTEAASKPAIKDVIVVTLSNSTFKDQAALVFKEGSTANYEADVDSPKTKNTSINLYSLAADGKVLAQNLQAWFSCYLTWPLVIDQAPAETYKLSFSHLESLSKEVDIILQDSYLNTSTPVTPETIYSFDITADVLTYGKDRFKLLLSYKAIQEITSITYIGSCTGSIPVTVNGTETGINYQLFNGTTAITDPISAASDVTSFSVSSAGLTEGNNTIIVKATRTGCDPVTMATELQLDYSGNYTISSTQGASSCTTASVTLSAIASSERAIYKWYQTMDAVTAVHEGTTGSFTTPVLEQSTTYYVAAVNVYGCESARTAVEAVIQNIDKPVIQLADRILKSNYQAGNQWLLDGAPIESGTESSLTPTENGTYGLEVTVNGCKTVADAVVFTVTGINDKNIEHAFSFYPNPSQKTFQIKGLLIEKSTKISYVLYQHNGTIVQQGSITDSQNEINIENLNPGLYLVKVTSGENVQYGKLMKK